MEGKKLNAKRQAQYRRSMKQTGKYSITIWTESESKRQFSRLKELLECNGNDAFDALMRLVGDMSDEELIHRFKGG